MARCGACTTQRAELIYLVGILRSAARRGAECDDPTCRAIGGWAYVAAESAPLELVYPQERLIPSEAIQAGMILQTEGEH